MRLIGVGLTTTVDLHGDCFTREALLEAQAQINGPACASVGLEHDSTIPPLGKVTAAEIQDREEGVTELIITQEIFENESRLILPDGTILFKAESDADRRPFKTPEGEEETSLSVDPHSFPAGTSPEAFFEAVAAQSDLAPFVRHTRFRKSAIPDAEPVIAIGKLAVTAFLGKKLVEKISDRLAEAISNDVAKLYALFRTAVLTFARYPWNRPACYVIQLSGEPFVEFVAKTSNPDSLINALTVEHCAAALDKALTLERILGATKVQFLLNDQGQWEFNFLLTLDGAVIGTEASYRRRGTVLRGFVQRATERGTVGRRLPLADGNDV